ncbi:hypothetical protein HQ576_12740, partial [bacterium]|nr:hypothetical protein [bacterium]
MRSIRVLTAWLLLIAVCPLGAAGEVWPAKAETIVSGRQFTEGPTWHP